VRAEHAPEERGRVAGDASRCVPGRGTMPGKLRPAAQKDKGLATRESISEQRTRGRRYTPAGDPWDGLGGAIWRIKAPARCTTRHAPEGILRYLFQFYPPPIQLIQDSAESFKLGKHRGNTRTRMGKISQQERVGVGWCACPISLQLGRAFTGQGCYVHAEESRATSQGGGEVADIRGSHNDANVAS